METYHAPTLTRIDTAESRAFLREARASGKRRRLLMLGIFAVLALGAVVLLFVALVFLTLGVS